MKIWKQILAPGTYWVRGPDGKPMPVDFSAGDMRHFAETGRAMVRAGLPIPLPLEHQKGAKPQTEAQRKAHSVEHNKGFAVDFKVDNKDAFWGLCDVPDENFAKKLDKEIKFVSPLIEKEWTDGNGKTWGDGKGLITHLALTPRPIWHGQKPFGSGEPIESKSLPVAMSHSFHDYPIELSMGLMVTKKGTKWAPLADSIELSGDTMADEKPDVEDDGEKTEIPPEQEPEKKPEESDDSRHFGEVKKLLEDHGIYLPPSTDSGNFMEHLCVALHALTQSKEGDDENPEEDKPVEAKPEEPMNVAMSQWKNRAIKAEKELSEAKRSSFIGRIDGLVKSGAIPKNKALSWKAILDKKEMSFGSEDKDFTIINAQLEILEEVQKGKAEKAKRDKLTTEHTALSAASAPTPDWYFTDEEKQGQQAGAILAEMAGFPPKK